VSFLLRVAGIGTKATAAADVTAPALVSAQIPAAGTTIEITFTESVKFGAGGNGGFVLDTSGAAVTLTYASGENTPTLVYTLSRTVDAGETIADFDYTQPTNGVEDIAGNDLATFLNQQALVTNNSTVGADVTAPTLSAPVDDNAGSTDGALTVDTDEDNGTLYWVISTSASAPSAAQVKAGQMHTGAAAADSGSQAVTVTGTQTISGESGLTPSTTYYAHFMHEDAATNQSTVASGDGFTTDAGGGDVTAPVLSSPTAVGGTTTGTGTLTVSTDEGNGTLYWVVTTSSTSPSAAQVKAGQDDLGATASDSGSSAVSGTGVQTLTDAATGLAGDFPYYAHFMHEDAATNQSTVVSTATPFDSQWVLVKFLLANEMAANASTTFIDQSDVGATVSSTGNPAWTSATSPPQVAWGSTCVALDSDVISVPDAAGLELGSGDFCIEFWARTAGSGTQVAFAKTNNAGNVLCIEVLFITGSSIRLYVSSNGTTNNMINGQALVATWSTNTWYHIAVSRTGTTWNGYVNGTRGYNATVAGTIADTATTWTLGGREGAGLPMTGSGGGRMVSGRLTVGAPRYTGASLTVPVAPFPTT
jgi:hypothetical protein